MTKLSHYKRTIVRDFEGSHSNGTSYDHRRAAEKVLGRPLKPHEVVHHIDEDKNNNSTDNLIVFLSNQDHSRFHKSKVPILARRLDGSFVCVRSRYLVERANYKRLWYHGSRGTDRATKIRWPDKKTVVEMTERLGFSATGRALGVSDNAVRKYLKRV